MSDVFYLKIDRIKLARRLSEVAGRPLTPEDATGWLRDNGFSQEGDLWYSGAAEIAMLEQAEVLEMYPADEPEGIARAEYPALADEAPATPQEYVLTEERRNRMALMPDYALCIVPRFLIGSAASVNSRWRPVARRIVRLAQIDAGTKDVDFVHVDDARGLLVAKLHRGFSSSTENIILYPILQGLGDLVLDLTNSKHEYYIVCRQLLMNGMDHFWFCLCFVATGRFWLPWMDQSYDADRAEVRRVVLNKMMRWWPHLCARSARFAGSDQQPLPWPRWFGGSRILEFPDAWQRISALSCEDAGKFIEKLLDADNPIRPPF